MLLRTIADNYGEIVFSNNSPSALEHIIIPDARHYTASGPFGELLFQEIKGKIFSVWHRSFLINRYTVFTCIHAQPCLKILFQLNNSIHYHTATLGNMEFHERGYNLCYAPSIHNRLFFRGTGLFASLEIYFPERVLQSLIMQYPVLSAFDYHVRQQKATLLVKVNQVATELILREISELLQKNYPATDNEDHFDERCLSILKKCLEKITHTPRLKPIRLNHKEIDQLYQAKTLLEKNMHIPFYLDNLASLTPLSAYQLKKGFRQLFDLTPADYLRNLRMEKAWALLKENGLTIPDVADKTGYGNPNSFAHAFKKYHYISPAIFVKGHEQLINHF